METKGRGEGQPGSAANGKTGSTTLNTEQGSTGIQECRHLELNSFKTRACKVRESHLPKRCPYYHDARKDKRRALVQNYAPDMCAYVLNDKECPYGESCQNAHNRVEEFYHPLKYKTKFCTTYPNNVINCEYGEFCCFAHSESDIKIDMLHKMERDVDFYMFHFKTVWCPFNETNHAREQCVYAHNWQDYRRKPHVSVYERGQCPNWDLTKIINVYYEGCANGLKCRYSHGWKEQEFHPLCYKTNHCRHGDACVKPHCPFYHNDKDRRTPTQSGFVISPRTRLFAFPAKGEPQSQAAVQQNVYVLQPTQPPLYVGSPMEGFHYSPATSPHMSPSSVILEVPPLNTSGVLSTSATHSNYPGYHQRSYPERYPIFEDPASFPEVPALSPGLEGEGKLEALTGSDGRLLHANPTDSIGMITEAYVHQALHPNPPLQFEPYPVPVGPPSRMLPSPLRPKVEPAPAKVIPDTPLLPPSLRPSQPPSQPPAQVQTKMPPQLPAAQGTKVGEEGKTGLQTSQGTNAKDVKREEDKDKDEDDYLDNMPTLTKDTLQFLRCDSDDDQEGEDKGRLEEADESDEGSEDGQEDEALARFLGDNQLGHLYKKFERFGITASNIKTLTAITLEQLGISSDDQQKLLRVLH